MICNLYTVCHNRLQCNKIYNTKWFSVHLCCAKTHLFTLMFITQMTNLGEKLTDEEAFCSFHLSLLFYFLVFFIKLLFC